MIITKDITQNEVYTWKVYTNSSLWVKQTIVFDFMINAIEDIMQTDITECVRYQ